MKLITEQIVIPTMALMIVILFCAIVNLNKKMKTMLKLEPGQTAVVLQNAGVTDFVVAPIGAYAINVENVGMRQAKFLVFYNKEEGENDAIEPNR